MPLIAAWETTDQLDEDVQAAVAASRPTPDVLVAREAGEVIAHMLSSSRSMIDPATTIWTAAVEELMRADGAQVMSVKTLGPSQPDPYYDDTRKFYLACGFIPVDELLDLWPGAPCLVMVKPVDAVSPSAASRSVRPAHRPVSS